MTAFLRKYPSSLAVALVIVYLSFFRPPETGLDKIPHIDKAVHFCMYGGWSVVIWLEYLFRHRTTFRARQALAAAALLPVAFSGAVELLQEYCTDYRGGDWGDFAANSAGVAVAGLTAWYVLRKRIVERA